MKWLTNRREFWLLIGLLILAVTVPTICLFWFMTIAVDNERLAMKQELNDFYNSRLSDIQPAIKKFWNDKRTSMSPNAEQVSHDEHFKKLVQGGVVDSAVIFGRDGRLMYPVLSENLQASAETDIDWQGALKYEYEQNDPLNAAAEYATIALKAKDTNDVARALQSQIRNLIKSGKKQEALRIITSELNKDKFFSVRDSYGRLIVPNTQLLAIQLINDPTSEIYKELKKKLIDRINDYEKPGFSSAQRLFIMEKLLELDESVVFPTRMAETYLYEYTSLGLLLSKNSVLTSVIPGSLYQLSSQDGLVTGLFTYERIIKDIQSLVDSHISLSDTIIKVALTTTDDVDKPFLRMNLGREMPDWELRLYYKGIDPFAASTERKTTFYSWIAILVAGGIVALVILIAFVIHRQLRLTRLKNDFVATISHGLKSPLASTRLFVDTLLEGRTRNEEQAREYLKLIAKENKRLSNLIDNFLTFSRIERGKQSFQMEETDPAEIANLAIDNVRERYEAEGCVLSIEIMSDPPIIIADRDAMITVLLNLLDNAFKYSGDNKEISLKLYVDAHDICFRVKDNGIGLSRRHIHRVFKQFYQVDTSLSKKTGGCGLGLSIVNFIVKAHSGSIDINSELGQGSTFTVRIPQGL